jgi:hypothetical protein
VREASEAADDVAMVDGPREIRLASAPKSATDRSWSASASECAKVR